MFTTTEECVVKFDPRRVDHAVEDVAHAVPEAARFTFRFRWFGAKVVRQPRRVPLGLRVKARRCPPCRAVSVELLGRRDTVVDHLDDLPERVLRPQTQC